MSEEGIPAFDPGPDMGLRSDIRRLASGSLLYGLGGALVGALAFILLPLYSRVLTPAEYGTVAVMAAVTAVLSLTMPLGLHGAVTRLYFETADVEERRQRVGAIWLAMVGIALFLGALAQVFGAAAFGLLLPAVPFYPYGVLAVWTAVASVFARIPLGLLQIEERAREYVALTIGMALLTTLLTVILVVTLRLGAAGYLAGALAAGIVMAPVYVLLTTRRANVRWRPDIVRSALLYGTPLVPHGLAGWTLELSDRAILQRFVSLASLGIYSLAYQFGVLMNVVGTALNNAWIPFVFKRLNEDRSDAGASLSRLATYFAAAIAWAGLGVAMLAGDAIAVLTPVAFHDAIPLAPWIVFGCALQALYYVPGNLVLARGRTSRLAIVTFSAAVMNVTLNLALVPRYGVAAAAWATFASYLLMLGLAWRAGQRAFALHYEYARLAWIGLFAGLLFVVGRAISGDGQILPIAARLGLTAAFPVLLVASGFARPDERQAIRNEAQALRLRWAIRAR